MPVAIVTGSNKGIGFAIVRALCKKWEGDVYLTSRDEGRGQAALETLRQEGLNPKFHVLDIGNEDTIVKLRDFMKEKYGGIDILVNNAGIAFTLDSTEPIAVQAAVTLETNYWANKRTSHILFPILNPGARVVNVSSSLGFLGHLTDRAAPENKSKAEELTRLLSSPDLSEAELDRLMTDFVTSAATGDYQAHGWLKATNEQETK